MTLTLTLPLGEKIYTGRQVTFEAPCSSEGLTGLIVEGVTYDLVNALGTPLVANSFDSGAMVSVIFNAEKLKAYVQNADTNAYLEDRFNGVGGSATSHINNKSNPHNVTASQVGLGNVPNVSTNDQTPTYATTEQLLELRSGEKLTVAFGKIAKAIIDLINHLGNKNNPHSVTKGQVGLGNVPNVSTNDQTPTYSDTTTLATLTSGEKMSVAFPKIKLAITNLINHINNTKNPHGVTASQVGAAASSHKHTKSEITDFPTSMTPSSHTHAASDIKAGTMPVERGGTGNSSVDTTPTSGSTKMVTSGGVYTALSGKANSSHNHSAGDITSGTMAVERGGTGVTSLSALAEAMGAAQFQTGSYSGSGTMNTVPASASDITTKGRKITLPCTPKLLYLWYVGNGKSYYELLSQGSRLYFTWGSDTFTVAYLTGNTLYVVSTGYSSSPYGCDNSGYTYNWFAFM